MKYITICFKNEQKISIIQIYKFYLVSHIISTHSFPHFLSTNNRRREENRTNLLHNFMHEEVIRPLISFICTIIRPTYSSFARIFEVEMRVCNNKPFPFSMLFVFNNFVLASLLPNSIRMHTFFTSHSRCDSL